MELFQWLIIYLQIEDINIQTIVKSNNWWITSRRCMCSSTISSTRLRARMGRSLRLRRSSSARLSISQRILVGLTGCMRLWTFCSPVLGSSDRQLVEVLQMLISSSHRSEGRATRPGCLWSPSSWRWGWSACTSIRQRCRRSTSLTMWRTFCGRAIPGKISSWRKWRTFEQWLI